jgi:hypothetical protein
MRGGSHTDYDPFPTGVRVERSGAERNLYSKEILTKNL